MGQHGGPLIYWQVEHPILRWTTKTSSGASLEQWCLITVQHCASCCLCSVLRRIRLQRDNSKYAFSCLLFSNMPYDLHPLWLDILEVLHHRRKKSCTQWLNAGIEVWMDCLQTRTYRMYVVKDQARLSKARKLASYTKLMLLTVDNVVQSTWLALSRAWPKFFRILSVNDIEICPLCLKPQANSNVLYNDAKLAAPRQTWGFRQRHAGHAQHAGHSLYVQYANPWIE